MPFCFYCGDKFVAHNKYPHQLCESCTLLKRPKSKVRYCTDCRSSLPTHMNWSAIASKWVEAANGYPFCFRCRAINSMKDDMRYSGSRPMTEQERLNRVRECSRRWIKKNPKKVRVSAKSRYRKELRTIHYVCPCHSDVKVFHHFDYDRPFDGHFVCQRCHRFLHQDKEAATSKNPSKYIEAILAERGFLTSTTT